MRPLLTRSVFGKTGQTVYRVPGGFDAAPSAVTVAGAAAVFTSTVDEAEHIRTITITSPAVTDGQEIRMTFDGLSSQTDPISTIFENPENLESGAIVSSAIGASPLWLVAIGNRNVLTASVLVLGTGFSALVEVTNDPTGVAGWSTVRGIATGAGTALSAFAAVGGFTFKVSGFKFARIRQTAQTAGSTTLHANLSYGTGMAGSIT